MNWTSIVPELILVALIILFRSAEPGMIVLLITGLLYGALLGAAWCTLLTSLGSLHLSKAEHSLVGAMGAKPFVSAYLMFGADFFTATEFDHMLFRNRNVTTQEERDIALLASFGGVVALVVSRAFGR